MTDTRGPEDAVRALLDSVARRAWDEAADLYADEAEVEHPNATAASPVPRRLRGRSQLRAHFHAIGAIGFEVEARHLRIHVTADPEVVIAEFEYHGRSAGRPEPFVMANVFVTRVRDGLIVESRDYQGPPRRE